LVEIADVDLIKKGLDVDLIERELDREM